jgi:hypothetical protein
MTKVLEMKNKIQRLQKRGNIEIKKVSENYGNRHKLIML